MTMYDLHRALRYADRFIFLKGGRVFAHGSHEIVTPGVFEEVYGLPVIMGELGGVSCAFPESTFCEPIQD